MKGLCKLLFLLLIGKVAAGDGVLDIAHRGYAAIHPESTLQAFHNAHQLGADGLEFDVRQTQDGVLIVTHDPQIPELGNRSVENIPFSDVYMSTDIPSLESVLLFAKEAEQTIWLEIKQSHRYPGIIGRVIDLIAKYQLEAVTVIQSFNHNDLAQIRRKQPSLHLLALYVNNFSLMNVADHVDYIGLPITHHYLNPAMIQSLHNSGKQIIFWRRNAQSETPHMLQQFIAAGADGFMLDRPLEAILHGE